MEIKRISIELLKENSWNPNKLSGFKYDVLVKQIAKDGMRQPLLVRRSYVTSDENLYDKSYEIVDGAHRFKAAKQAGLTELDCVVVEMSDEQARAATIAMNNIRGKFDDLPLAGLLQELSNTHNMDALKELTAFNERELTYYLKLLETPTDFSSAIEVRHDMPVTLTFIVSEKESQIVNDALEAINPENKSKALVKLCLEQLNGKV